MNINDLDKMLSAYMTCALWASMDNSDDAGGDPLDKNYSPDDIDAATLADMKNDCQRFIETNGADLADIDAEQAGHDLWLTRNGHGAGFWDRGLGELGERLAKAARKLGGRDLMVNDNGSIGY